MNPRRPSLLRATLSCWVLCGTVIGCGSTFSAPGSAPGSAMRGASDAGGSSAGAEAGSPSTPETTPIAAPDPARWSSASKQARQQLVLGDLAQAESLYGTALDAVEALPPYDARREAALGNLTRLAEQYWMRGRREDFARAASRVERSHAAQPGFEPADYPRLLYRLADTRAAAGRFDEAVPTLERALAVNARVRGERSTEAVDLHRALVRVLSEADQYEAAADQAQRAIEIATELAGPDAPELVPGLSDLARVRGEQQRFDEALSHAERALRIEERANPGGVGNAMTLNQLAWIHLERRDTGEAVPLARQAVAMAEAAKAPDAIRSATLDTLASALALAGNSDQARRNFRLAIETGRTAELSQRLETLRGYESLLRGLGRQDEAARTARAAEALAAGDLEMASAMLPLLAPRTPPARKAAEPAAPSPPPARSPRRAAAPSAQPAATATAPARTRAPKRSTEAPTSPKTAQPPTVSDAQSAPKRTPRPEPAATPVAREKPAPQAGDEDFVPIDLDFDTLR